MKLPLRIATEAMRPVPVVDAAGALVAEVESLELARHLVAAAPLAEALAAVLGRLGKDLTHQATNDAVSQGHAALRMLKGG